MHTITQKFAKVNERADERSVYDSIDRPIRPLVYQINRIGIPTKFSCCGFNYDGEDEDEPKSHAPNAYVQFMYPKPEHMSKLLTLLDISIESGWTVRKWNPTLWIIQYELNDQMRAAWQRETSGAIALHDYEYATIAIHRLTKRLEQVEGLEEFEIIDGNHHYHQMGIDWQIKPKMTAKFSVKPVDIASSI